MSKLLLYILLLCSCPAIAAGAAQADSIAVPARPAATAGSLYYNEREFDENFRDGYTVSDFKYETKTAAKSGWDRFWEAVGEFLDRIFRLGDKTQKADGFTIAMRILAFLLVGVAVYFIARALLNKQGYWIFGRANRKITVQDAAEENIHEMDFGKLVNETKQSGNFRLAVRYYYLWLLKKLSNREVIDWHWDKTNSDYLYEIRDNNLKKDFEYLSYVYDHSWYGEFQLDERAFAKAERAFLKL